LTSARRNFLTGFFVSKALVAHAAARAGGGAIAGIAPPFHFCPGIATELAASLARALALPAPGWVRKGVFTHTRRPFLFPGVAPYAPRRASSSSSGPPTHHSGDNPIRPAHFTTQTTCDGVHPKMGSIGNSRSRARGAPRQVSRDGKTQGCPQRNLGRTPDGGSRPIGLSSPHPNKTLSCSWCLRERPGWSIPVQSSLASRGLAL
jgi:hypothetical protein